jgi:FtsZ-interacting cell division protein YlmF
MSLLSGVLRLFGADDDVEQVNTLHYPAPPGTIVSQEAAHDGIIELPQGQTTTIFVVRPEKDDEGRRAFSPRTYAKFLLTRQALVLDVNSLAAVDVTDATRLVDYLAGVAESVSGDVWQVTKNIFIFAPQGVKLVGDPLKQVEVL